MYSNNISKKNYMYIVFLENLNSLCFVSVVYEDMFVKLLGILKNYY